VAAGLGYCALDRRRSPLDGDEVRECWEADLPDAPMDGLFAGLAVAPGQTADDVVPARDAGRRNLVDARPVMPARPPRRPAVSGS
jgi:hypothetical protein